jgi:hypothetical protein
MRAAERIWNRHSENEGIKLHEWWNYHNKLESQFPLARLRVVYAKAGTLPAATLLAEGASVIDHMLYWAAVSSKAEGYYLCAVLNAETSRNRVAKLQARGQWGARHFDKVMFTLPIPRFDSGRTLHTDLAAAAREAEQIAKHVALPEAVKFQRARKLVRDALASASVAGRIEALVARLLDDK